MKLLFAIQVLLIHLLISMIICFLTDQMNYRYWTWVSIGLPVSLVFVHFFLPKHKVKEVKPVENEELFDHLFIKKTSNKFS